PARTSFCAFRNILEGRKHKKRRRHNLCAPCFLWFLQMYFFSSSSSRSRVFSGAIFRSVKMACFKACPHLHVRSTGRRFTDDRITFGSFSFFFFRFWMPGATVPASCCGCQQS